MTGDPSRRLMMGAMASLAAVPSRAAGAEKMGKRPNILWLVSEDNNPYIGAYGDRLAHTPTIDALAAKGVLFRRAYSAAPVCAPSRFAILTGLPPESCAPANQMRAVGKLPKAFRTYPELMRAAGYFCTNESKTDYNCDVSPEAIWDIQGSKGHWRHRGKDQPFMSVFNYGSTHESMIFRPMAGRVTPDKISVPPFLPDTPGVRQDFASYYNLMEKMDGEIAKRLAELEADGLADDTIIFYYSDNGGVLGRSKRYCYEEGLRCALIVYAPPKWQHLLPVEPGEEIASPVSFIDLAPTVLALAGVRQPPQMRGRSLLTKMPREKTRYAFGMRNRMDERIDFVRTVTDGRWRYIRNYMPHRPWGQHQAFEWLAKGYQEWEAAYRAGTLTPEQAQFFGKKPFEELYDLEADPHQMSNRVDDPAAGRKLRELRRALDAQMTAVNDNGFLPETMVGEGFMESRAGGVYPLPEVMALAEVAARGDLAGLPALRTALSSKDEVLRYWAATGYLILGAKARGDAALIADRMRNDGSSFVRIVAAEATATIGDAQEAVAILAHLVETAAQWQVQLHALNALTFIGGAAKAAEASVRRASQSDQEFLRSAGRYLAAVLDGSYAPSMPIFDIEHMRVRAARGA